MAKLFDDSICVQVDCLMCGSHGALTVEVDMVVAPGPHPKDKILVNLIPKRVRKTFGGAMEQDLQMEIPEILARVRKASSDSDDSPSERMAEEPIERWDGGES